ncbi:MAG: hypothetical protein NT077_03725 [Candidatus Taylorbacteria bacterium]|nr:hypothetical protein [Candidatus Taylorbacteria bacterium]
MKSRYYVYLVFIIIVVVLVAVLTNAQPSYNNQGAPVVVSKKVAKPAITPSTAVKTVTPAQVVDRYYPIHVIKMDVPVYYSSTTVDQIKVSNPPTNSSVSSPLTVTGVARGTWYFEGTAPILLTDSKGKIIAEGYVRAQSNWMTNEFVPFMGTLNYVTPVTATLGVLVLKNDNPSGLAANAKSVEVIVRFR